MFKRVIPAVLVTVALTGMQAPPAEASLEGLLRGAAIAAQGLFITERDEIALGEATARQILQQIPRAQDPALEAYVTGVGRRLAAQSERPQLPYRFFVLESKDVNAFAAPGGFLFVTTGALRLMQNEAQLAGVLGHEIAHVAKKHSVNAIRKTLIAQGIATAILTDNPTQLTAIAANIGATLILRGFDRQAETEADLLGAGYAFRSGYDPRALSSFLTALARTSGEPPRWLAPIADHPRSDDRIARLNQLLARPEFQSSRPLALGTESYQRAVTTRLARPAGGGAGGGR